MATFVGQVENNEIIFAAWVSLAGQADGGIRPFSFMALLDTGAQITMISPKVVDEAGLRAIGHTKIVPVTGKPVKIERFRVRIDIPIGSAIVLPGGGVGEEPVARGMDLEVGLLPHQPNNHDVLLGMDFISAFHVTMFNGQYILSN